MIAIDTNVVVRLIVGDDQAQTEKASKLLRRNEILITATVVLETEWVLRSVYKLAPEQIAASIGAIAGLENVEVENATALATALSAYVEGMDFADAMHITRSTQAEGFATFDEALRKHVQRIGGLMPVVAP